MLQLGGRAGDYSVGTEISDNTLAGNGATPQCLVNDVDDAPEPANITRSGNTVTTSQYVAALPFNGEQGRGGWSQQAYDLTSWANLPGYDATSNTWTGLGGSFVNAFQLRPGSGQTSDPGFDATGDTTSWSPSIS